MHSLERLALARRLADELRDFGRCRHRNHAGLLVAAGTTMCTRNCLARRLSDPPAAAGDQRQHAGRWTGADIGQATM